MLSSSLAKPRSGPTINRLLSPPAELGRPMWWHDATGLKGADGRAEPRVGKPVNKTGARRGTPTSGECGIARKLAATQLHPPVVRVGQEVVFLMCDKGSTVSERDTREVGQNVIRVSEVIRPVVLGPNATLVGGVANGPVAIVEDGVPGEMNMPRRTVGDLCCCAREAQPLVNPAAAPIGGIDDALLRSVAAAAVGPHDVGMALRVDGQSREWIRGVQQCRDPRPASVGQVVDTTGVVPRGEDEVGLAVPIDGQIRQAVATETLRNHVPGR